ncbi:MAG: hypothetical protein JWQ30_2107 [Sediminibacterium sp.]|nr:hypothetical protein [Sediminibacterium sp.]
MKKWDSLIDSFANNRATAPTVVGRLTNNSADHESLVRRPTIAANEHDVVFEKVMELEGQV